ncbi:hypothetical protein AB0N09_21720 [Streptomyces erythrochromogenes]|uniref:hypothetical protein n=1 Tax=Streptomyces erythrochromogenes TaxID=285574 RepID=UPI0034198A20
MTDTAAPTRADLLAEITRLRTELDRARELSESATEYRVPVPEGGGTVLLLRRQELVHGLGWAISTRGRGGGLAFTTEGWQDAIGAMSVDRLFCWRDPVTALAAARSALAGT